MSHAFYAGMPSVRVLAATVQTSVVATATAMALNQLGVAQEIIVVAFTIVLGGRRPGTGVRRRASLAKLGGQEMARDALRRLAQPPPPDQEHEDTLRHL